MVPECVELPSPVYGTKLKKCQLCPNMFAHAPAKIESKMKVISNVEANIQIVELL